MPEKIDKDDETSFLLRSAGAAAPCRLNAKFFCHKEKVSSLRLAEKHLVWKAKLVVNSEERKPCELKNPTHGKFLPVMRL